MSGKLTKAARLAAESANWATEESRSRQADSTPEHRQGTRVRKQTLRYGQETSASSEGDLDLGGGLDEVFTRDPPVTAQQRPVFVCSFAKAANKKKLRTLLSREPSKLDGSNGSNNGGSSKRKAPSGNAVDGEGSEAATHSVYEPPKKQRRPNAKASAVLRATAASVQNSFPEPQGQPEVWADDRQSLCESLPYYQAFQSAAYVFGGFGYGWLLDNDNDERGYLGEEFAISRFGGGFELNMNTGKMERAKPRGLASSEVKPFMNNMRDHVPVNLIVGAKNPHCPSKMPHRYNVMTYSMVTYIWSEKVRGMTVAQIRLQKINLQEPSWWAPKDSPLPRADRDYVTKAPCQTCSSCSGLWSQVYLAGWMCLNDACPQHFLLDDGETYTDLTYNPVWVDERSEWPSRIVPPFPLKPPPTMADSNVPSIEETTSLACWKGMVCPKCGRCNSRTKWDEWRCFNQGCDFACEVKHTVFPPAALVEKHGFEFEGHAISYDSFLPPVTIRGTEWSGFWRQTTYEIPGGNTVTHFHANAVINRQPGGANDILEALQGSKLGLERSAVGNTSTDGLSLARHFAINYGMPYKYVISVKPKGFSEAPPIIMDVVNRLTWAGKKVVNDGTYQQFNELLCLGYFEKQSINYHSDGEKDLGPTIASLSLGGSAAMTIRMKASYHFATRTLDPSTYDPHAPITAGTHLAAERLTLRSLYDRLPPPSHPAYTSAHKAYTTAKDLFFAELISTSKKKTAPAVLSMDLKHGDVVVMQGADLQLRWEHAVMPKGKLRYGLTCRYVEPGSIDAEERWKGDFEGGGDEGLE